MSGEQAVLFSTLETESGKRIGVATLNSERSLNALSLEMIELLEPQLKAWEQDPGIVCVWLDGAGEKAFCAGGDIVKMYHATKDLVVENTEAEIEPVEEVVNFFTREYELDHQIRTYAKPIIVWGHGFVMGGGMGLMNGASHRVVTEQSRLAMPEISIGLYPDVGGTWFLSRLPEGMGLFLGLTATQVNATDALWLGMADVAIPSDRKEATQQALLSAEWQSASTINRKVADEALRSVADATAMPEAQLAPIHEAIRTLMSGDSLPGVVEQLLRFETEDSLLQRAQKTLKHGCPMTAHIIWQQLQHGEQLSLADVFRLELTLSVNCAMYGDFIEGVRALLIDKDRQPKWRHESVDLVSEADIDAMFASPWSPEAHPLKDLGE
ncbi:MAG: Enoyl-CoA hydratase/carnithine racemase [Idiomarinaceae bacterium HL-53]|nr:MAG: Enoyl-CoA hydratase/carnithine racemase [Idiomarinaceae bacterium HL-53]CUS49303.1 Enoyl-CoA hydratase/carnithine racemase [Idiomarinaceae bacterium HL-53]